MCIEHGVSHAFGYFHKSVGDTTAPPPHNDNEGNSAANRFDIRLIGNLHGVKITLNTHIHTYVAYVFCQAASVKRNEPY